MLPETTSRSLRSAALVGFSILVPLGFLGLVLARPQTDARWQSHPGHFWLVLAASLISLGLGYSVNEAARTRRDSRLFLVSLAFMGSAGFLGLHALATPGVLLGRNAGFELATPVGLVVAGGLAALSSLELSQDAAARVIRRARLCHGALLAVLVLWGGVSLAEAWPLDRPLEGEVLDGWQASLAALGVALYGAAALGYYRLYRRRRSRVSFAVAFAFALLAEAMVVIAWARNWRLSWWEWHVLMLLAFLVVAVAARREWHEERFSALYLDETLAGAKDVSILFADLSEFTAFSERATPSAVAEMLNGYFGRIVPLMQDLGGDVHQIVGDEIMVIFNKEGGHPEHALLAARAALLLQSAASDVARDHPEWPRFRAGVNSGEVLAGVVGGHRGHRKHGVVGDTVNLASRLEGSARVGEVVVGEETARRLPEGTLLERLPEVRLKGKEVPVQAYVLRGLR